MFKPIFLAVLAVCISFGGAFADSWHSERSDSHAPIGVMGDHFHENGETMFSYRFMRMEMEGLRSGTGAVSTAAGLDAYMMVPLEMSMDMHMLGAMHAISDETTLMVMLPYLSNKMDIRNRMGATIQTDSEGLGDIRVSALKKVYGRDGNRLHMNVGVSLPTGATDEENDSGVRLPYPMQLGSGTLDLMPGLTWFNQRGWGAFGAQVMGTIRTGLNSEGYALGNQFEVSPWVQKRFDDAWSGSVRLKYLNWGKIRGFDSEIPNMPSTGDEGNFGGSRVDLGLGVNFLLRDGMMENHRFSLEYSVPVFQELNGLQLALDSMATLGWQFSW